MKFIFFFALSALLGALYAIYAPEPEGDYQSNTARDSSQLEKYQEELRVLDARIRVTQGRLTESEKKISSERKDMNTAFSDLRNRTPQLQNASSELWIETTPEASPLMVNKSRYSNVFGMGGLEMRANKIHQLIKAQTPISEELASLKSARIGLADKINALKKKLAK